MARAHCGAVPGRTGRCADLPRAGPGSTAIPSTTRSTCASSVLGCRCQLLDVAGGHPQEDVVAAPELVHAVLEDHVVRLEALLSPLVVPGHVVSSHEEGSTLLKRRCPPRRAAAAPRPARAAG